MQKVTLQECNNEQKTSKAGKPYTTCSIKVNGVWYNGFGNKDTYKWKSGDEVLVETYEEDYNGKMYKKFKTVTREDMHELAIKAMVKEIKEIKAHLGMIKTPVEVVKEIMGDVVDDVDLEPLPF